MSTKAERAKRSFAKRWFAVISGSMCMLSTQQAAQASHGHNTGLNVHQPGHRHHQPSLQNHVHNQSLQNLNGDVFQLNNGVDLNLSATDANITLGSNLFRNSQSVTISVGGETKTFGAGSQVTSAEYVAVKQVLSGHNQSITVDGAGRAAGGQFDLNSISASNDTMRVSSLVIPENVTADGQFGRGSEFRLVGNLDNFGSLVASSNSKHGSTIHADDISNHSGASIESVKNDLHLVADGSLTNDGSISSSANLTISAGSGFSNSGTIQAKNDVSLSASSINNSGTISATNGSITLDSPAALTINNTGGQLVAVNGDINLRSPGYAGASAINLTGGDLLSKTVNISSGNAFANININELTGEVNQTGLGAHVLAATDVLNIGSTCLTGDPTYYNTAGSINISGNLNVAEALTLVAAGDITSANSITITANNAAQGFPINMIAGANITFTAGGSDQSSVQTGNPNNGSVATVNGNVFGGSIILGTNVQISTRPTNAAASGADVIMDAFAGVNNGSGRILISGTTIKTGGVTSGANGNVTLIAGIAGNTDAIVTGTIDTTGGSGAGGGVSLNSVQPVVAQGKPGVAFLANGDNTGVGTYVAGVNAGLTGNIRVNNPITANNIIFNAGNSIFIDTNLTTVSGVLGIGHGNVNLNNTSQLTASGVNGIIAFNFDGNIIGTATTLMKAPSILLISNNGKIGVSAGLRLRIDADALSMTAVNGSAFINDIDDLSLSTTNIGGTLDVASVDNLSITGVVTGDTIKLSGDAITIGKDVTGGASLTLNAGTDIVGGGGRLSASNVFLTAASADAGSNVNPILTNADNLVANAPVGAVVIQEQDSVNISGNSSAKFDFTVTAAGALSSASLITGNNVNLTGSSLALSGQIIGATSATLYSLGDLNNGNITGSVSTPALTLKSNSNIGTSLVPFKVNGSSNLQSSLISGISVNQSVFIEGASGTVFGASSALSNLSLSSTGSLTIAGNLVANTNQIGTINVLANGGTLQINDGIQILSQDDINIRNAGTSKTDKLAIGNNVNIATNTANAGDGNISIVLGTPGGKTKTKIKNVQIDLQGGTVSIQNKGLAAVLSNPLTKFTAIKANITTGNSINGKNFTLGNSVTITADPPAPLGTPMISSVPHHHNELVANTVLTAPASLDEASSTAVQVSANNVSSSESVPGSSLFNTLATLPGTLSLTPAVNSVIDDSYMTTSQPKARNVNAKLVSHKQLSLNSNEETIATNATDALVDQVIGDTHNMDSDSAVVVATRDMKVVSPVGSVNIAAGAIAFITTDNGRLSVYDLEDRHKGSVVVETDGRQISLCPGTHLTVTRDGAKQYADINPVEMILHRSMNRQVGNANSTIFHSEFSIPSAIEAIKPLMSIIKSNNVEAKKIRERLMKTAAIRLQLGGSAPYSVHAKTRVVALNR